MRAAVIGGGPAGLAAALALAESQVDVTVYEAGTEVGGLASSLDLWGWKLDLGSHVLSTAQPEVAALLHRVLDGGLHRVPLQRGIVIDGRCFAYPLRPLDIARRSGLLELLALGLGFVHRRRDGGAVVRDTPESAETWVVARYGRAFHDRFFAPYAERLWGLPTSRIEPEFARRLAGSETNHSGWSPSTVWRNLHPAPSAHAHDASFWYPSGGVGAIPRALVDRARAAGAQIRVATPVRGLSVRNGRVEGVQTDADHERYDEVVAAVPLPFLARLVDAPRRVMDAAAALRTRATLLVYLEVVGTAAFPELWRYVCGRGLSIGRVANVARWWPADCPHPAAPDRTVLICELWCDIAEPIWGAPDEAVVRLATSDLHATGMIDRAAVRRSCVRRVPATHLVPELGSEAAVSHVRAHLATIEGLDVVGRGAGIQDVGTSLWSGLASAKRIIGRRSTPMMTGASA
jgi:protoporphyrinogen oxidase